MIVVPPELQMNCTVEIKNNNIESDNVDKNILPDEIIDHFIKMISYHNKTRKNSSFPIHNKTRKMIVNYH